MRFLYALLPKKKIALSRFFIDSTISESYQVLLAIRYMALKERMYDRSHCEGIQQSRFSKSTICKRNIVSLQPVETFL